MNKKQTIKIISFFLLTVNLKLTAQKLEQAFRHAGYGQLENVALLKDNSGNNVVVGSYAGSSIDVDPGPATVTLPAPNSFGFYVLKYDLSGNYINGFGISGSTTNVMAYDAARDNNGNYYVVGNFKGVIDFDPSATVYTVTNNSPTNGHGFIAKYDQNFNFQWIHHFNNTSYSNFQNVKVDNNGRIYISGYFWGTEDIDFGPATTTVNAPSPGGNFIAVYDNSMNLLHHMVNVGRFNSLIDIDASGNIYTAGSFNVNTDFDPSPSTFTLQPAGSYDAYFAKYSPSLTLIWANSVGNTNSESPSHIKVDNANNVLLSGTYSGLVDFDPGPGVSNITSFGNDYFLLKLNTSGTFAWAKTFSVQLNLGNVFGDAIQVDAANNIYFTGGFNGVKEFNYGSTSYTMQATGDMDGFLAKYSPAGNLIWAFRYGGPTPGFNYTYGHSTYIDNSGAIDLVGSMRAVTDFDPSPYETFGITAFTSFYNGYICRYNQLSTGTLSSLQTCVGNTLSLNVPYTIQGTANAGNIFSAQLSDAAGNFSTPVVIGTLSAVNSGTISAVLPSTLSVSNNYKIRVVSSNPPFNGERSASTLTVLPSFTISLNITPSVICAGQTATAVASGASTYTWFPSGSGSSLIVTPTISTNYSVVGTNTNGCLSSNSPSISVTVNPLPTLTVSSSGSICAGQSATLMASGANTYTWLPAGAGSVTIVNPSVTTVYTVTGQSAAGCQNTATITQVVVVCTGISESLLSNEAYLLYPNPASHKVYINRTDKNIPIKLFNGLGQIVLETNINNQGIDTESLPDGIYFIEINKNEIQKLIIKH